MTWEKVLPSVWMFRDSCNVYALEAPDGMLVINAGTGKWLSHLGELPEKPVALVCTHFFRDHAAGAALAAQAGLKVYAPEGEKAIFLDPNQHFRQRETYIIYDNLWDLFAPIEGVALAGTLQDYERATLAGREIEAIPLPGATMMQTGIGTVFEDGRRVVFCGEAIHSPGKLPRVAPLQYNYNDLSGAAACYYSAQKLRDWKPDALLPSLGTPMLVAADAALAQLQENLKTLAAPRAGLPEVMTRLSEPPLQKVTDHVWFDAHSVAHTWYLISESGKALAMDYGYHSVSCSAWSGYAKPERRRALLHGLEGLKQQFGIEKIDVVLVSHFHDDHVCGIPNLQRLFGTECWAAENFADLLERPEAHCFPCCWPQPIRVDRRLPLADTFQWEEYTFRLHPMSGHTRFSALIGFEADGKRFAHTGDQYFFQPDVNDFSTNRRAQNHVYRNGALLDGYDQSGDWMLDWRPEIVIQGHQPPMFTDDAFFRHIEGWRKDYAELHRLIMPLDDAETHFDLDSWGGWLSPYRTRLDSPETFEITATVRNPFPHRAHLTVRLKGAQGWQGEEATLLAEARQEVACVLKMTPKGTCRRQPIAVELKAEGRSFGQVAEALVTIGSPLF